MSAFRGILTGFGMAAIKDKEAKDNAKMEVVKAAGIDYHTNQLPAHKKMEANRAAAYKQLTTILGSEEAVDFLDANGVGSLIHYPIPPHRQEALESYNNLNLPITEGYHDEVVSIPLYASLTDSQVQRTIEVLNAYV